MQDLHRAYGEYGYIDLSSVPTTRVDEERLTVSIDIDLDESKQFYVDRIDVIGSRGTSFPKCSKGPDYQAR
jgi:outer membrane protein assembly factor BamA